MRSITLFIVLYFCFFSSSVFSQSPDTLIAPELLPVEIIEEKSYSNNKVTLSRSHFLSSPGSFDDPARLLLRHPGFSTQNDQSNFIIYDGMPPHYMKWSMYGAEIINPNHLSNAGMISDRSSRSAGGVNMFSGQVLGKLEYNGNPSFTPVNSIAGTADMRLRRPYQNLISMNVSLAGLEAGIDRKLNDAGNSFMLNYRYSTVGLLTNLGLDFGDEEINYQDITGQFIFNEFLGGTLTLFGTYGASENLHAPLEDSLAAEIKDVLDITFDSKLLVAGLNHDVKKEKVNIKNTLTFSRSDENRNASTDYLPDMFMQKQEIRRSVFSMNNEVRWPGKKHSLSVGNTASLYDNFVSLFTFDSVLTGPFDLSDVTQTYWTITPYVRYQNQLSTHFLSGIGMRLMYDTYKEELSFLPNLTVAYKKENMAIHLKYSKTSQMQAPEIYGLNNSGPDTEDPDRTNAHHIGLSLDLEKFGARLFYHRITDIPALDNGEIFFTDMANLDLLPYQVLSNEGEAEIYGIGAYHRYSFKGINIHTNLSLLTGKQSTASTSDINIPYNFGHIVNLNLSKKYKLSDEKYIAVGISLHERGGVWQSEVDTENPGRGITTTFKTENPYSVRLQNYYRLDARISYIKKKVNKKYKSVISLDLHNVTNKLNDAYYYYEPFESNALLKKQLGLIPILSWRVEF